MAQDQRSAECTYDTLNIFTIRFVLDYCVFGDQTEGMDEKLFGSPHFLCS